MKVSTEEKADPSLSPWAQGVGGILTKIPPSCTNFVFLGKKTPIEGKYRVDGVSPLTLARVIRSPSLHSIILSMLIVGTTSWRKTKVTEDDTSKHPEKGQEKSGPGFKGKKTLIIAGIVIALFLIAVIAVPVMMRSLSEKGTGQSPGIPNFVQPGTGQSAAQTTTIPKTIRPAGIATIRETSGVQAAAAEPVDFSIHAGVPASCGLTCRQLDATLTNTGSMTAHNVCITVSMHNSKNEIIKLNGESTLNRCVGDVAGGQAKTERITINADCGPFATKCIGETLTLQTQAGSDEKTVRFPDQVISV